MTMAAFTDAASAWAAAGIVPLPVYPDGKKTMVKQPGAFGRPAAMGLAAKPRYAAANLGFFCGSHNRLTVVDIDSPADAELQHALTTYGESPIIVQTPSGGRHVYYAHNDEPRSVRLDKRHPIDMLGGGLVVAPPSVRPSGASYDWLRGGLADIANGNLPKIRRGALRDNPRVKPLAGPPVPEGERNAQLFRYCRQIVGYCDDLDQLIDAARTWSNSRCVEPETDAKIVATANSVWKYQGGRKRVMQNIVEGPLYQQLIADVEVWALYAYLATENGPAAQFMVADGLATARGWPRRMVPRARRALLDMGAIKCVRFPRKGVPALYRWNLGSPLSAYGKGEDDKGLHTDSGRSFGPLP
jgi:Bifunctional DNA primase/polymerase, N-terminal/Primase C terminal 1 (PriCT-1)